MSSKLIPFLNKLFFNVYVIGYQNQGESIIFTLENDFGIAYSGVIDCFEIESTNKTLNLLNELGIKFLDILCWSHPHEDHSFGMEKLLKDHVSDKTNVIFPDGLNKLDYKYDDSRIEQAIELINKNIVSSKLKKPQVNPVSNVNFIDKRQVGNEFQNSYELEITSISPIANIVEKRELLDKLYTFNDFSVALLVSIGGVNFLFSGDIQDTTINKVKSFIIPDKIDYVKIPHHSSSGSLALHKWLEANKTSISCTTEFTVSGLPKLEVLDKYKLFSDEIYCTNKKNCTETVGVVHTTYDVLNKTFYSFTKGSAFVYHKQEQKNIKDLI